jgi:hypothetical protein
MKRRWLPLLGLGGAYLLLTLVMLWPLPRELGRAVPGEEFDIWQNTWNLWWVRYCLWEGNGSLFYTSLLYHPGGAGLLFHTLSLTNTILALPVTILWGPVAAYGVVALLSYVLGGFGAALLVIEVLEERPGLAPAVCWGAALLGGATFAFSSYHLAHTRAHLHMLSLQWLAFYAWALLRAWKRPGLGRILVALIFLLLTSWTDWYYAFYALFFTGLFLLVQLVQRRFQGRATWSAVGRVVAVVIVALAVLAVQWVPMLREQARNPDVRMSVAYAVQLGADPLAYVTPGPLHPLWGRWTMPLYRRYSVGNLEEGVLYLGIIPLALALYGARRRWAGRGLWLTTGLVCAALSLGPVLHWAGEIVTVNGSRIFMPYALLHLIPLMDIARVPARFGLLVTLAVAVLAGVGLADLLQARRWRGRWRLLLAGGLTFLLCAELAWLPYPVTPAQVPPFYQQLAGEADGGALLQLPIVRYPQEHTERLLYQTVHEHPTFGGYISRGDPHIPYEEIPGFRTFQSLAVRREITEPTWEAWREQSLAALSHYGAVYVVVQRPALAPGRLRVAEGLAQSLLGAPAYQDDQTSAYRVPPVVAPFWELGSGWGPWKWREGPARSLQEEATLRLVLPETDTGQICLRCAGQGETVVGAGVDDIVWGVPAGTWCLDPHTLSAGSHEVVFWPAEGKTVWVLGVWWDQGAE